MTLIVRQRNTRYKRERERERERDMLRSDDCAYLRHPAFENGVCYNDTHGIYFVCDYCCYCCFKPRESEKERESKTRERMRIIPLRNHRKYKARLIYSLIYFVSKNKSLSSSAFPTANVLGCK